MNKKLVNLYHNALCNAEEAITELLRHAGSSYKEEDNYSNAGEA